MRQKASHRTADIRYRRPAPRGAPACPNSPAVRRGSEQTRVGASIPSVAGIPARSQPTTPRLFLVMSSHDDPGSRYLSGSAVLDGRTPLGRKIKLGFVDDISCRHPMVHRAFKMTSRRSTAGRPSSTTVHMNGSNPADASARPNWSSGWIDQAVGGVRGPQPRTDTGPIRRPMIAMTRRNT
jgi:hypothetical protein